MILHPTPYPYLASQFGVTGQVTLLGAPLDRTGSFRAGCALGPEGIRWASENLETYSPEQDRDLEDLRIGDLGDLDFTGLSQQQSVELIEAEVGSLLDAKTLPFIFGGEHTIALPIARAVLKRYPDARILHFDAHADLRDSYEGESLSHAAWAYHVGQEFGYDRLLQLGIRSGLREEFRFARTHCGYFCPELSTPPDLRVALTDCPIYISLDIDVLDASVVPGTGTPEAGGATYRELMACLHSLSFMNVVAMDINELAPPLDPTGVSSAVAAKISREMMLLFGFD